MSKMFTINDISGHSEQAVQHAGQFLPYAHKKLGFNKPVSVNFISDPENAKDPLGKTAYYDPNKMEITIFVDKRHVKDILRSLSHELVHHSQNCRGEFDSGIPTEPGYAQKDPHMRKMEAEAYLLGNGFLFRDWEDQLKQNKGERQMSNLNETKLRKYITNLISEVLEEGEEETDAAKKVAKVAGSMQTKGKKPETAGEMAKKAAKKAARAAKVAQAAGKKNEGSESDEDTISEADEDLKAKWKFLDPDDNKVTVVCDPPCSKKDAKRKWSRKNKGKNLKDLPMNEKQFANDDNLDGDKDGKPKWADPDDPANESWTRGSKDDVLFEKLVKKWAK